MILEKILKENNLRITKERKNLFNYMKKAHIFNASNLIKNFSNIWRASIFRTLKTFLEIGLIRKINIWDSIETYEFSDENHHHEHIRCKSCWKIESIEIDDICKKIIKEAEKKWFSVKNHSVNITWTCPNCK